MKKKKYSWQGHSMGRVSAQAAGEEIERLEKENDGALLPITVVRAAKPRRSPIHDCFEWDDRKAALHYREDQARELLRKIVIVYKDEKGRQEHVRAFCCIQHEDESYYCATYRVVQDEELQQNVLDQILADLLAIKKKYAKFKMGELQKIWDAIDEFISVK